MRTNTARLWIVALSMSALLSGGATAGPVGLSLKANTLGVGADLTVNMGKWLNARAGINYGQFDFAFSMDEADVIGELRWRTIPVLLDWHPTGKQFRFSLGGMFNGNRIGVSADPYEPIKFQGTNYSIDGLDGSIEFDRFSPYLGIGYGNATGDGRFHFACDIGIMYHGKPIVRATVQSSLPPALQEQLDRDFERELDEFRDSISDWRYYPLVSIGFSFSF